MHLMLILNHLLINIVGIHPLRPVSTPQRLDVGRLEFARKVVHHPADVLAKDFHLAQVRIRGQVAFEAVFVAALLGAHLAVEFEFLEAFGFHAVGDVFGGASFGFWHGGSWLVFGWLLLQSWWWWWCFGEGCLREVGVVIVGRGVYGR